MNLESGNPDSRSDSETYAKCYPRQANSLHLLKKKITPTPVKMVRQTSFRTKAIRIETTAMGFSNERD